MGVQDYDRKGLIRESYRIGGITAGECRSIFLDWALSLQDGQDQHVAIRAMLAQYEAAMPGHPMTGVLQEGLLAPATPRRRGGWRARMRPAGKA